MKGVCRQRAPFYTVGLQGALGDQLSPAVGELLVRDGLRQVD